MKADDLIIVQGDYCQYWVYCTWIEPNYIDGYLESGNHIQVRDVSADVEEFSFQMSESESIEDKLKTNELIQSEISELMDCQELEWLEEKEVKN